MLRTLIDYKKKNKSKYIKLFAEFLLFFALISALLFLAVNYNALKGRLSFWVAKTFNFSSHTYFAAKVDGLGVEGDLMPPDDRIVIPKLGVNVPLLVPASLDIEGLLADLNRGALLYPNTALPGQKGNAFIAGHSSQNPWESGRYKTVFSLISNLEFDDPVIVYFEGQKFVYYVENQEIVPSTDLSVLEPTDNATLTLMTCWPVGTTAKRLIVTAHLQSELSVTNSKTHDQVMINTGQNSQGLKNEPQVKSPARLPAVR